MVEHERTVHHSTQCTKKKYLWCGLCKTCVLKKNHYGSQSHQNKMGDAMFHLQK